MTFKHLYDIYFVCALVCVCLHAVVCFGSQRVTCGLVLSFYHVGLGKPGLAGLVVDLAASIFTRSAISLAS